MFVLRFVAPARALTRAAAIGFEMSAPGLATGGGRRSRAAHVPRICIRIWAAGGRWKSIARCSLFSQESRLLGGAASQSIILLCETNITAAGRSDGAGRRHDKRRTTNDGRPTADDERRTTDDRRRRRAAHHEGPGKPGGGRAARARMSSSGTNCFQSSGRRRVCSARVLTAAAWAALRSGRQLRVYEPAARRSLLDARDGLSSSGASLICSPVTLVTTARPPRPLGGARIRPCDGLIN